MRAIIRSRMTCAFVYAVALTFITSCQTEGNESNMRPLSDSLRVLSYNIHHAEGMDGVTDLVRIADLIKREDPDIVTIQEVDSVTVRTGGVDQAAELGALTGYHHTFSEFMPYQGGGYGMAVLSRWPILKASTLRLPDGEEPRTALAVTVALPGSGRKIRVVGIHFYMTEEERMEQAVSTERQLSTIDLPTILLGDFNSEPDDSVMDRLGENWTIVDKGDDHLTFSSFDPVKEIDYVLLSNGSGFKVLQQYLIDEPVISDHRPYVVDLILAGLDSRE